MQLDADLIVTAMVNSYTNEVLNFVLVQWTLRHSYQNIVRWVNPYAIMNRDKRNWRNNCWMVAKMDAGAIISQRAIPVLVKIDVASMFA